VPDPKEHRRGSNRYGSEERRGRMANKWHLTGTFYESCRQSGHCALWFGRDLTEGPCTSFATFQIKEGNIDGVAMDGISIINCGDGIGPTQKDLDRSQGGGIEEGTVYISDNADEGQRAILKDFMQNHLGTELWKKVLDVKFVDVDIEYDPEQGHCHISFPFGETTMDKARGIGGKFVKLENCDAYNQSVPITDYHICNSWAWWYKDMGKDYQFRHTSGTIGSFDVGSES
jgi:hypothetical protein